ncbi:hypothetical protein AB0O68_34215 [Streptomyces sp. NPDC087512]|uniref:hypothetical protein n=1 Tax=Streptomyces sp. NPDC087512 TaxID=3155059 RepID=UPI003443CE90
MVALIAPAEDMESATATAGDHEKSSPGDRSARSAPPEDPPAPALAAAEAERLARGNAARQEATETDARADGEPDALADTGQPALAPPPPIGDDPDPTLLRQCFSSAGFDTDFGRVHNRFTYCNERRAEVKFYWVINGRRVWRGTNLTGLAAGHEIACCLWRDPTSGTSMSLTVERQELSIRSPPTVPAHFLLRLWQR